MGMLGRELLTWAFQGVVPVRYQQVARPGRLYRRDVRRLVAQAIAGIREPVLAGYAGELLVLVTGTERQAR